MNVRDALRECVESNDVIEAKDLAQIIEEQFDVTVTIEEKKDLLSDDDKDRITKELSTNKEVIGQLKKSQERRRNSGFSSYLHNKEEFKNFLNQAHGGRQ